METQFKALMIAGQFVDADLLGKGIYFCDKPFIYDKDTTVEALKERASSMVDMVGNSFLPDKYFDDLSQCELVLVTLTINA